MEKDWVGDVEGWYVGEMREWVTLRGGTLGR
jgi:hypothetical protein